jgi:hypothetical protein
VCEQLKGNSVAVWKKGDFVLKVQGILRVDIPRIAACVVFLGLCLSVVLCVIFVLWKIKRAACTSQDACCGLSICQRIGDSDCIRTGKTLSFNFC